LILCWPLTWEQFNQKLVSVVLFSDDTELSQSLFFCVDYDLSPHEPEVNSDHHIEVLMQVQQRGVFCRQVDRLHVVRLENATLNVLLEEFSEEQVLGQHLPHPG
jgi:hypothetical protein